MAEEWEEAVGKDKDEEEAEAEGKEAAAVDDVPVGDLLVVK